MTSPSTFREEILNQPRALERLLRDYSSPEGQQRLRAVPAAQRPVLLGMGASYHSALIAAQGLARLGVEALALEAAEALGTPAAAKELKRADALVYISQSGASAEVGPLLDAAGAAVPVIALTNHEHSLLARRAQIVLPLLAGDEQTVATKTYANSVALLWLLARHWAGTLDTGAFEALEQARERLAGLLAEGAPVAERWIEKLGQAGSMAFIGAGLEAVTARQAAMIVMEWLRVPALSFSVGAFRHGPIEIAQPGVGCVLFAPPGPAYASTRRLAQELEAYGASVLVVENGHTLAPGEAGATGPALAGELRPLVDVAPVQLFVEALARRRGLGTGFRHIGKVV
jgi:glucosamine--fructose-6-phosphate aminotransferase (isomerizing)